MKSFEDFGRTFPLDHEIAGLAVALGKLQGKAELHRAQIPQALETLKQAAIIQSTESSNRIEGVITTTERLRSILADKTTPANRSEAEILGYRDVLNTIHCNFEGMTPTANLTLQLHRDLMKYTAAGGGRWKMTPNEISEEQPDGSKFIRFLPPPPHMVDDGMRTLHENFARLYDAGGVDPLFLIAAYILDFLCIHPFTDGNGRMARLLTTLLLYRAGYDVGRYVSLEKIIETTKTEYYDALYRSSQGWHEGTHTLTAWTRYLLGVLIAAYREFERRVGTLTAARGAKSEMVMEAIRGFNRPFSREEIVERCPGVSVDLVRKILNDEGKAGRLKCVGRGPSSRWEKVIE